MSSSSARHMKRRLRHHQKHQTPSHTTPAGLNELESSSSSGGGTSSSSSAVVTSRIEEEHDAKKKEAVELNQQNQTLRISCNPPAVNEGIAQPFSWRGGACNCSTLLSSVSFRPCLTDSSRIKKLRVLNHGSSSKVYLAMDTSTFTLFAIKEIALEKAAQIRNEVNALKPQLQAFPGSESTSKRYLQSCPEIVTFYGWSSSSVLSVISIGLEYCPGGSCQEWIDAGKASPEPWVAHIAADILKALGALHARGWIHRDIKPANILLTANGDAKLADFGLSVEQCSLEGQCSTSASAIGTLKFMSPECMSGLAASAASDVWSLGLSLACMVMGGQHTRQLESPFALMQQVHSMKDEMSQADSVTSELTDFLCSCLIWDPSIRPSVEELKSDRFLATRGEWRRCCPTVMVDLQSKVDLSLECILDSLDLRRCTTSDTPAENDSKMFSIANALGTTKEKLRLSVSDYSEGKNRWSPPMCSSAESSPCPAPSCSGQTLGFGYGLVNTGD